MSNVIYPFIPIISGISTLWLALLVLLKNRKAKVNQTLFIAIISISIWLLATSIMFLSKEDHGKIFWDRIVYIGVVFVPVTVYHFGLSFIKEKEGWLLYLGYFFSFLFLLLSRTNYFIEDLYKYTWGSHTQARFFHHIFLIFFVFYILLFFLIIYQYQRRVKGVEKTQANYILLGFFVLSLSSFAFLPAYGIDIKFPFPYLTSILLVLILSLAIIKYHLFEIRVLLTELLVGVMGLIWFVFVFLMPSFSLKVLAFFTFLLFCLFGYYLIKSVHEEAKRREEAEVMAIRENVLREEAEKIAIKESALRKKAEKIAQDFQRLTDIRNQMFLTGHHHTRTPLSHIKNFAWLLFEGNLGPINEKQKRAAKIILDKVEESIDLANLYLSVAQLEAGEDFIDKEKIDFAKTIREQIKKLSDNAKLKEIKITSKLGKDLPEIMADQKKLGTAIYTLIDNAIKYTPKGGKIELGLGQAEDNKILFFCKDNGIGVKKEDIDNIGKVAFQRTKEASHAHGTGKGLALYLSNLIIAAHSGRLWAESEGIGKGTTFYIELPVG